jgi:CelD/BcsL family acetyltransferase involved in cellulose biosynthesis
MTRLRALFPQFAETGPGGGFKQQDSEEFHNTLMTVRDTSSLLRRFNLHECELCLSLQALSSELKNTIATVPALKSSGSGPANVVDALFGVELEVTCVLLQLLYVSS